MKRVLRAAGVALVGLLVVPGVAWADGTTIVGTPQVGNLLDCSPSSYRNNPKWFHSTDLSTPIWNRSYYHPVAGDLGTQLVCQTTVSGTTSDSAPSAPVLPLATVSVKLYSAAVSGNIGESLAGATVNLSLERGAGTPGVIATGTATTNGSGEWVAALRPANPASGPVHGVIAGDALTTQYSPPSGSPSALMPPDFTYAGLTMPFGWISADGSTILTQQQQRGCGGIRFVVDGSSRASTPSGGFDCAFSPSSPLTDADHVQVMWVQTLIPAGSAARLIAVADTGLLGAAIIPPACTADLVLFVVKCSNLNGGQFAVSADGAAPVALDSSGQATLPSLKPGDVITLDETSPAVTTRHLTTLHVTRWRLKLVGGAVQSGSCLPGELLQSVPDLICPPSGTFGAVVVTGQVDDRSGGLTTITPPSLLNFIPAPNDSITGGNFNAYADLASTGTGAQLMAQTKSVRLSIRPHGSTTRVFSADMTPHSDSDGAYESVAVTGLTSGLYFADWLLTDINGDTDSYENQFAVQ